MRNPVAVKVETKHGPALVWLHDEREATARIGGGDGNGEAWTFRGVSIRGEVYCFRRDDGSGWVRRESYLRRAGSGDYPPEGTAGAFRIALVQAVNEAATPENLEAARVNAIHADLDECDDKAAELRTRLEAIAERRKVLLRAVTDPAAVCGTFHNYDREHERGACPRHPAHLGPHRWYWHHTREDGEVFFHRDEPREAFMSAKPDQPLPGKEASHV